MEDTVKTSQKGLAIFTGSALETGGQVSVHISEWYLLEFIWDYSGKWNLSNNQYHLSMSSPEGRRKIEILPSHQDSIILGVWILKKGYYTEQNKILFQINPPWVNRVWLGNIKNSYK